MEQRLILYNKQPDENFEEYMGIWGRKNFIYSEGYMRKLNSIILDGYTYALNHSMSDKELIRKVPSLSDIEQYIFWFNEQVAEAHGRSELGEDGNILVEDDETRLDQFIDSEIDCVYGDMDDINLSLHILRFLKDMRMPVYLEVENSIADRFELESILSINFESNDDKNIFFSYNSPQNFVVNLKCCSIHENILFNSKSPLTGDMK